MYNGALIRQSVNQEIRQLGIIDIRKKR